MTSVHEDLAEVADGCELVAGSCERMAAVLCELAEMTRDLAEQMSRHPDPRQARGLSTVSCRLDEVQVFGDAYRWRPEDGDPWIP